MASGLRIAFWLFVVLYAIALFLLAIGTFGWFGQEKDPLSGVFLIPLGLPWNVMLDGDSEMLRPWLAIFSPALNLLFLGAGAKIAKRN